MLTRLFNNITLAALLRALFVAFLLTLVVAFLLSQQHFQYNAQPITLHPIAQYALVIALVLLAVWNFSRQVFNVNLLKPSYLPVVTLASFVAVFGTFYEDLNFCFSLLILSFCVGKMLHLSYEVKPHWLLTEIGMATGIGIYINSHFVFVLLLTWMATVFYGSTSLRNFLIPAVGIFISCFTIGSISWLYGNHFIMPDFSWQFHPFSTLNPTQYILPMSPLAFGFLLTLGDVLASLSKGKVNKRQGMGFMLGVLGIALCGLMLINGPQMFGLILCFPLAIFNANYIIYQRKWFLRDFSLLAPWISLLLIALN
jgi:hypothetical protein